MKHTLTLTVLRTSVLLRDGTDAVSIEVDKPSPFPPGVSTQNLRLSFECTQNRGISYCRQHLGVHPDVIDARGRVR